jgi:hypothetical protein
MMLTTSLSRGVEPCDPPAPPVGYFNDTAEPSRWARGIHQVGSVQADLSATRHGGVKHSITGVCAACSSAGGTR